MNAIWPKSPNNTQDKAYRHIRRLIVSGEISLGAKLVAFQLASRLGVSRTPVREALSRLEQEGLVQRTGGWGYRIREMRIADVEELFKVREALEILAVHEAMPNIDAGLLAELEQLLQKATACKSEPAKFISLNREFYGHVFAAARNQLLRGMLTLINDRVQLIGAMTVRFRIDRAAEVLKENRALLKALKRREPSSCESAVREHIRKGREHAIRMLERGGSDDDS